MVKGAHMVGVNHLSCDYTSCRNLEGMCIYQGMHPLYFSCARLQKAANLLDIAELVANHVRGTHVKPGTS